MRTIWVCFGIMAIWLLFGAYALALDEKALALYGIGVATLFCLTVMALDEKGR